MKQWGVLELVRFLGWKTPSFFGMGFLLGVGKFCVDASKTVGF